MSFWNNDRLGLGRINSLDNSLGGVASKANIDAERLYRESMNVAQYNPNAHQLRQQVSIGSMSPKIENRRDRELMLSIRMRVSVDDLPFDDIHTSLGKEKVFVFIVQNDKPVILEDDVHLYPSDTLITQLRLIAK